MPQDAVDELGRVVGCVALGEFDRLVDRDLRRHLAAIELLDRYAQRAPFDDTQAVGGPGVGRCGDPLVELGGMSRGFLGELARPRVDLLGDLRAALRAREVPLVDPAQRLATSLAA
jgi:hypothetical protein